MHIHNIALSLDDLSEVSTDIKIKQNDGMAHKFVFGGLDFSDAERAVIKFLRADGVTVCDKITYNDSTAEYVVCPAALAASGTVKAEVSLYGKDMRITSCNFSFEAVPDINVDFALTDTDTFPVFDAVLKDMDSYVKKADGKELSSNDYTDDAREAVDKLGYSIDPNYNVPTYSSKAWWTVSKLKSQDSVTGGLQVDTYLMLNTKNGLRDVVYGSSNLQSALDDKADKEDGKGLSANDYTDEEKAEVAKIVDKLGQYDYATNTRGGVIKVLYKYGLDMLDDGFISVNAPTDEEHEALLSQRLIQEGVYQPITYYRLNQAVKAALSDDNRIDDMLDFEKTNARKVIDAVGFYDYADEGKAGVVKVKDFYGTQTLADDGTLTIVPASQNEIKNRNIAFHPIIPTTLDYAVRSVRPSVVTALPAALSVNTIYALDYVYPSLSLVLPSGEHGDFIQVDFSSGATPTNLTITSSTGLSDIDLIPEANTTYSLYFEYGCIHADDDNNVFYGWRFGYSEYPYEEV